MKQACDRKSSDCKTAHHNEIDEVENIFNKAKAISVKWAMMTFLSHS